MPKLFGQTMWLVLNSCFPSGSLASWYMLGRGCLHGQPPINLSTESNGLPWWILYMCCHTLLLEELSTACVTQLGEASWKLVPDFTQSLSHAPFPLVDLFCNLLL